MAPSASMQFKAVALLVAILLSIAGRTAATLGINCRGSGICASKSDNTMSEIFTGVQAIPDGNVYSNGQHVYCTNDICAFLQNVSGTKTAGQIKGYIQDLLNHNCKVCGSDPTEPGNNVANGELTVNYVAP